MLKQVRRTLIHQLWDKYRSQSVQTQLIEKGLKHKGIQKFTLDHFAIIDLPGPHTGISHLNQLFSAIGYIVQGRDYLPDKQNDFLWMTECDSLHSPATEVLPQVVVADFRLDELPLTIRKIIEKYAAKTRPSPVPEAQKLAGRAYLGDEAAANNLYSLITHYLSGRDWPLPTINEFHTVQAFNELLAWVLVFGRTPNHFTLSVHLLDHFSDLNAFHAFIETEVELPLNQDGGVIKGGPSVGIAQGSTAGMPKTIPLADGSIQLPTDFVEFVWRYPCYPSVKPVLWEDYFTGFVAQHADRVIESLYGDQ
ncbi:DUF1338 domain-containing protein [Aquicella lusitana]|uniref:2-oxoadipate dioxygenase/decarboxylase n=1 Tax=Aquicella lusitana TaxID=254246 RepID=A0A370GZC4_9COXI|nr:DUF1338 domain-containing protein [Aquicella lusitana]RDI48646.1 uncharacterized protein DUF1338 [Aquicella lusitana]VVC73977.1 hypothetical protein AQULUS_17390 [Aquicella lusitana]